MGTNWQKSIRDGIVAGGPTGVVIVMLQRLGLNPAEAAAVAPFVLVLWMRAYRALRTMQNPVGAFIRSLDDPTPTAGQAAPR